LSAKRVRVISKLAPRYKLSGNKFFIEQKRFDKSTNEHKKKWLEVPPIDKRLNIIARCHNLGHYQKDITLERIEEEGFSWFYIKKDIVVFIGNCMPCNRCEKYHHRFHKAQIYQVNGYNSIVHMDCVWGLPTTIKGHWGVCIMTQKLTKLIFVKPLKTKRDFELCRAYSKYTFRYGRINTIVVTDLGGEFCNILMDYMFSKFGIEHRVTASHNPKCNGEVERANQTFINILRKVADQTKQSWYAPVF
jgi:hypothetical protein